MYRIGVIGAGVVGRGIIRLFKEEIHAIYDPFATIESVEEVRGYGYEGSFVDKEPFKDCEMVAVCVMTKSNEDGSCDTSIVEESLAWLSEIGYEGVILIKSAVVPSEIARLWSLYGPKLVVSPEYMGESKYFTPFWKYPDPKNMESHTWQVFGGSKEDTSLCVDMFKRRMSVDTIFLQTTLLTGALCKYMENAFFALKVTFCNEWFDIASAYGIDYNELRECWLADTRINRNHTLVFPKDRGYGGKCFPKDVKAIIRDAKKIGVDAELMRSVDSVNERIRNGRS